MLVLIAVRTQYVLFTAKVRSSDKLTAFLLPGNLSSVRTRQTYVPQRRTQSQQHVHQLTRQPASVPCYKTAPSPPSTRLRDSRSPAPGLQRIVRAPKLTSFLTSTGAPE
ncbi:uncharacterized protein B0H18DRAFT_40628 [Fomitopsis serialis]|uniref:uncharacterized protein n=1 Tax=Fomitopsis serialis TaxID=139415 RepID=UPI0020086590|nr:uncharacterized protein B0H18DRAFT_40628 [Neoantrodia serialis]KAH9917259.1 hypothetical protein B0H18DRAFT_40628 [Neoantrodia serialis]